MKKIVFILLIITAAFMLFSCKGTREKPEENSTGTETTIETEAMNPPFIAKASEDFFKQIIACHCFTINKDYTEADFVDMSEVYYYFFLAVSTGADNGTLSKEELNEKYLTNSYPSDYNVPRDVVEELILKRFNVNLKNLNENRSSISTYDSEKDIFTVSRQLEWPVMNVDILDIKEKADDRYEVSAKITRVRSRENDQPKFDSFVIQVRDGEYKFLAHKNNTVNSTT